MSEDNPPSDRKNPHKYIGNHIPFFIKLAWVILILWILYYLLIYMIPDLKIWMGK